MRNIRLTIEYDGINYAGWQTQRKPPGSRQKFPTIQETIERALHRILREKIRLTGSGRTDSGVHAVRQVANFKTASSLAAPKIQSALNALLPADIAVTRVQEADLKFHATRSVKSKVYRYTILNRPYRSALLKGRVYFCRFPLDIALMRRESRALLGKHDFRAFCSTGSSVKNTVRTIKDVRIKKIASSALPCPLIVIDIEADGFLYNMARSIAGTLIDIGRARFKPASLKKILLSKDRSLAGTTAPACGLYLLKVKY
jgi:tRNA pseudouridine38-40 synthase